MRTNATVPLVTINRLRPILVRFAVPAANLPLCRRTGQEGHRGSGRAAGGGGPSEGALSFVDNAVDTTTGTILLKGRSPTTMARCGPALRQRAPAALRRAGRAGHPIGRGGRGQQGSFVFVIQAGQFGRNQARDRELDGGRSRHGHRGFQPGDRVVVDGQLRLRQGSKVQIKATPDTTRLGAL